MKKAGKNSDSLEIENKKLKQKLKFLEKELTGIKETSQLLRKANDNYKHINHYSI